MTDVPDCLATARHRALWPVVVAACPSGELAHDAQHVLRVYRWAVRLADEAQVSVEAAGATALVHDLVFVPKDSDQRSTGGERSAAAAPAVLAAAGYTADEIAAIAEAVRTSSWSRGLAPTSALGALLQDADRLDALGAIGLARLYACAQFMSTAQRPGRLYDPADPTGDTDRPWNDKRHAVDHIRAKLLHLAAGMHLPSARREAGIRHQTLLDHLEALRREV